MSIEQEKICAKLLTVPIKLLVNILTNKKTHSANFTVCSLCVLFLYDKILFKTTELEGGALPKFFGMEVMSMVYFSFQDLMSFGIFIVALLTFIFQNRK